MLPVFFVFFIQMISGTNVLTSHPRPYFICGVVAELQI